jgi:hypothetical protein
VPVILLLVGVWLLFTALPFMAAATQWRRARTWFDDVDAGDGRNETHRRPAMFDRVWFQTESPRISFRANKARHTGSLLVDPAQGEARFETEAGFPVHLTNVSDVSAGRRGSDKANTWIEVHGEVESKPTVVFVTDATWYGWRPILSRSNEEIAKALTELRATAPLK